MKYFLLLLVIMLNSFISNAQVEVLRGYEIEKSIINVPGTIKMFEETYLIEVSIPEENNYNTFLPFNLKKEFQVDGMKVVFGGIVGKVPIFARMLGTPIHITSIRKYIKPKSKVKSVGVKKP